MAKLTKKHAAMLSKDERSASKDALVSELTLELDKLVTDYLMSYQYLGQYLVKQAITEVLQGAIKTL